MARGRSKNVFDVAIVGGGLVGLTLAHGLSEFGITTCLVERGIAGERLGSYSKRAIALSFGSARILDALGAGTDLWTRLQGAATEIRTVHVSERGRFGRVRINARDLGVPALGYVVTGAEAMEQLLWGIQGDPNVTVLSSAEVRGLTVRSGCATLELSGRMGSVDARLVVAADGDRSAVRALIGAPTREHDYGARALVANITGSRSHFGTAYERFTRDGPLALLPMSERQFGLVWSAGTTLVEDLTAMDDLMFLRQLHSVFGLRAGEFLHAGARASFPLKRINTGRLTHPRVVLIGSAANHLHPVAGQGFNLGLRDVASLCTLLGNAHSAGRDLGARSVLERYVAERVGDQCRTMRVTDGLARIFVSDMLLPPIIRSLGMLVLDNVTPLKRAFAHEAMGMSKVTGSLARGVRF